MWEKTTYLKVAFWKKKRTGRQAAATSSSGRWWVGDGGTHGGLGLSGSLSLSLFEVCSIKWVQWEPDLILLIHLNDGLATEISLPDSNFFKKHCLVTEFPSSGVKKIKIHSPRLREVRGFGPLYPLFFFVSFGQ